MAMPRRLGNAPSGTFNSTGFTDGLDHFAGGIHGTQSQMMSGPQETPPSAWVTHKYDERHTAITAGDIVANASVPQNAVERRLAESRHIKQRVHGEQVFHGPITAKTVAYYAGTSLVFTGVDMPAIGHAGVPSVIQTFNGLHRLPARMMPLKYSVLGITRGHDRPNPPDGSVVFNMRGRMPLTADVSGPIPPGAIVVVDYETITDPYGVRKRAEQDHYMNPHTHTAGDVYYASVPRGNPGRVIPAVKAAQPRDHNAPIAIFGILMLSNYEGSRSRTSRDGTLPSTHLPGIADVPLWHARAISEYLRDPNYGTSSSCCETFMSMVGTTNIWPADDINKSYTRYGAPEFGDTSHKDRKEATMSDLSEHQQKAFGIRFQLATQFCLIAGSVGARAGNKYSRAATILLYRIALGLEDPADLLNEKGVIGAMLGELMETVAMDAQDVDEEDGTTVGPIHADVEKKIHGFLGLGNVENEERHWHTIVRSRFNIYVVEYTIAAQNLVSHKNLANKKNPPREEDLRDRDYVLTRYMGHIATDISIAASIGVQIDAELRAVAQACTVGTALTSSDVSFGTTKLDILR